MHAAELAGAKNRIPLGPLCVWRAYAHRYTARRYPLPHPPSSSAVRAAPISDTVTCELETRGTATNRKLYLPVDKTHHKINRDRDHTKQSARGLDPKVRADAKRTKPEHRAERGVDVTLHVQVPAEV